MKLEGCTSAGHTAPGGKLLCMCVNSAAYERSNAEQPFNCNNLRPNMNSNSVLKQIEADVHLHDRSKVTGLTAISNTKETRK